MGLLTHNRMGELEDLLMDLLNGVPMDQQAMGILMDLLLTDCVMDLQLPTAKARSRDHGQPRPSGIEWGSC